MSEKKLFDLRNVVTTVNDAITKEYLFSMIGALFVTFLWSSSFVIIKIGFAELSPLVFSGLRYSIASIVLLTIVIMRKKYRSAAKRQSVRWWVVIALYGVVFVAITQGAQFLGLYLLPAIMVSMLLNLTPLLVIFFSVFLKEVPSIKQLLMLSVAFIGVYLYFFPFTIVGFKFLGLVIMLVGVVANALSAILGRSINRQKETPPVVITGISMGIGSMLLLGLGIIVEGVPILSFGSIVTVLWLSVVNTALAFTLWNRAMQHLRAIDISIINSTMLPQIAILSMLFLGEFPSLFEWMGLSLVIVGVALVQLDQMRKIEKN